MELIPMSAEQVAFHRPARRGFTLVELLVVIAIIGVLVSLLLPAVQSSRESGRRASCANNLKQIGLAIENYQLAKEVYPPSSNFDLSRNWSALEQHSWASMILPYLEQASLFETIDFDQKIDGPSNRPAAATIVPTYRCPAYTGPDFSLFSTYTRDNGTYAIGNYVAFSATDVPHIWRIRLEPEGVIFPLSAIRPAEITDGLSHTVFIVESREENQRVWMDGLTAGFTALPYLGYSSPTDQEISLNYTPYYPSRGYYSEYGPSSMHPDGAYHLVGDGSVRFITDDISRANYLAFCTREGGEVIDDVN